MLLTALFTALKWVAYASRSLTFSSSLFAAPDVPLGLGRLVERRRCLWSRVTLPRSRLLLCIGAEECPDSIALAKVPGKTDKERWATAMATIALREIEASITFGSRIRRLTSQGEGDEKRKGLKKEQNSEDKKKRGKEAIRGKVGRVRLFWLSLWLLPFVKARIKERGEKEGQRKESQIRIRQCDAIKQEAKGQRGGGGGGGESGAELLLSFYFSLSILACAVSKSRKPKHQEAAPRILGDKTVCASMSENRCNGKKQRRKQRMGRFTASVVPFLLLLPKSDSGW